MGKDVLIVGDGSYLADGMNEKLSPLNVERIHYIEDKSPSFFSEFNNVINFGIQPDFSKRLLDSSELIDAQLANVLKGTDTKLVMLSSRKVYGSHKEPDILKETDELIPTDFYSANKIKAEQEVNRILPDQHLILRIGNILGLPVNRIGYKTFVGWISDSLRDKGHLFVTEHPETKKDFISKEYFQHALSELVKQNATGTINIGSGFAIPLKELLSHICGEENIIFADELPKPRDQFILDNQKLLEFIKAFTYEELVKKCEENKNVILATSKK